jgi:segregation and condensation protein B
MMMKTQILEAVLFASDAPIETGKLIELVGDISEQDLTELIAALNQNYEATGRTFRIVEVAGGFQFETLSQYGPFVEKLFHTRSRPKLSRASLETLAIVAYKQPITRAEIDALRGVDSDTPLRTLVNRDLIEIKGRSDAVGKPLLYGTTTEFLRYFGLKDIQDLPGADELASMFDGTEVQSTTPEQLSLSPTMDKPSSETNNTG